MTLLTAFCLSCLAVVPCLADIKPAYPPTAQVILYECVNHHGKHIGTAEEIPDLEKRYKCAGWTVYRPPGFPETACKDWKRGDHHYSGEASLH